MDEIKFNPVNSEDFTTSEVGLSIAPDPMRSWRCKSGHKWEARGTLEMTFMLHDGPSLTTERLCPYCFVEKVNELFGGVSEDGRDTVSLPGFRHRCVSLLSS